MLAVAVSVLTCCKNQVDDLLKSRVFLYCADMLLKAKSYDVNTWAQKTYIYVNTWVIIQPVQCSLAFLKMHRYCDVLKADIFGWLAYCEIMRLFQWDNSTVSCSVWESGLLCWLKWRPIYLLWGSHHVILNHRLSFLRKLEVAVTFL